MYENQVNGKVLSGEHLTGNLQFYSVTTSIDITPVSGQANLNKLIEVISLNGQPVIMGAVTGTGPYSLKFAIEHAGSWADAATLVAAIKAHAPAFAASTTTATIGETL